MGTILPFACTCLYLAFMGVFHRFWFWTFDYAHSYATLTPWATGIQILWDRFKWTADLLLGFWILAVVGMLLTLGDKTIRPRAIFAMFFWICSFLGTATGLIFREHYFILVLPAFALFVGLAVGAWRQVFSSAALKALPLVIFVTILGWDVWIQKEVFFRLSPIQASQTIYPGNPFVESLVVAEYIREHSSPADRLAVLGSEPEIYFLAQRHSATGYIYTFPLMELQPYAGQMQREMISEIESNRPAYLVLVMYKPSWLILRTSDVIILHWFDAYTGAFYKRVGVVGVRPTGETVGVWDPDAGNFHEPLDRFIMIYRRRADSATGPARLH